MRSTATFAVDRVEPSWKKENSQSNPTFAQEQDDQ